MKPLSKSRLINYRQCPKRLWLEIHRKDLKVESAQTTKAFKDGHQVGDIARQLYDTKGKGILFEPQAEGYDAALARSAAWLRTGGAPLFEAGFSAGGALAFADVMLPKTKDGQRGWRMVEVKSSTEVKDYHRDDVAIQAFIARKTGVALHQASVAHIDETWIYSGHEDYQGLLVEEDLTEEAFGRGGEVKGWIAEAQAIALNPKEPRLTTGAQCHKPYECGFLTYCQSQEPQAEYPIQWLPRLAGDLEEYLEAFGLKDMRDVPDDLLSAKHQRIKTVALTGKPYFDQIGASRVLAPHSLPAYFMDFETINFAVPRWKGYRPYQRAPFQFSMHTLARNGKLMHQSFLDLSPNDPGRSFAEALLGACGDAGPIFVYSEGFETSVIKELAKRYPRLSRPLLAMNDRVVDLLPVAREHYYHPAMKGKWGIKSVLPALCGPSYRDLDGVQSGGLAMDAYVEATDRATNLARKAQIEQQLLAYCKLDTLAMVKLWSVFTGKSVQTE